MAGGSKNTGAGSKKRERGNSQTPAPKSNAGTAPSTPLLDTPSKAAMKDSIKVNTDVPSVVVDTALLDRLSPSVRDVAQHAAVLKSVLARLGPIYDLVEREASRMTEVSPFLAAKDQVCRRGVVWIPDINLIYRPGGRSEKSFGRRVTKTRREDPRHQDDD